MLSLPPILGLARVPILGGRNVECLGEANPSRCLAAQDYAASDAWRAWTVRSQNALTSARSWL